MSEERKLILKMVQENRITLEEAEKLLDALEAKSQKLDNNETSNEAKTTAKSKDENIFQQASPKVEQMMGSISSLLESVANQWGPSLGEKFDHWFQQAKNTATGGVSRSHHDFKEKQVEEEVIPLGAETQKIVLKNYLGDTQISGYEGSHIQVRLEKAIDARNADELVRYQDVKLGWKEADGGMYLEFTGVDGLKFDTTSLNLQLKVPQSLDLDLSSKNHDLLVKDLKKTQGKCVLRSQNGDVALENVAVQAIIIDNLSGNITVDGVSELFSAKSHSGDILIKGSLFEGDISTKSGFVRVDGAVNKSLAAETDSGDLSLNLLDGKGQLKLQSKAGDIELSGRIQASAIVDAGSGDLQGEVSIAENGSLELKTHSGDIDLILGKASDCLLEVQANTGDIEWRLELEGVESSDHHLKGKLGSGRGLLKAETQSGDVLIS